MSDILKRKMFQEKAMKADSGITQGFDAEDEPSEDEMMEEVSYRKPNSPEILMNNLRGDMRSVDARYQELADMVGEEAAMDTPPEVLAMLQAQLAQPAAGIGALPPGQGMSPPPSMPAGQPPMPAPQGFANGGIASLQSGALYTHGTGKPQGELETGPAFTKGVAHAGRNGDTVLAHITPGQEALLTSMGGGKTYNPDTGLPEHWLGATSLLANVGQRAMPYVQAADRFAGSLMNPVLTSPTLTQSRTTLGTFGPKVAEGMETVYPALSERVISAATPITQAIANNPTVAKIVTGISALPGAAYLMGGNSKNMVPGNKNAPVIPGDTATGWVPPPDAEDGSTPINWDKVPPAPADNAAPAANPPANNQQFINNALTTKPKTSGERLEAYMTENLPVFEKYMGGDKDYAQSQALFLLADMGLKFASERKPGESVVSSLSRSAQGLPAGLSALGAQEEAARRQIKGAALTSGLQTIAAEDKQTALTQREIIKQMVKSGELKPTDLGAGLTSYTDSQGQPKGMRVDETLSNSFLNSRFTPQLKKDDKGEVQGFDTPYARTMGAGQTLNLDKGTRERLAGEVSRQEQALAAMDDAIKEYTDAFGPKAFASNLKNNLLVPVTPLDANVLTEQKRTKINVAINTAAKAIAKTGDTGNIAVAEQKAATDILGDKPGTFWSDSDTALKRMMTVRTALANQRLNTAAQLGWVNQDIQLDVPNLGTAADPIPQDKLSYVKSLAKTFPNGQVYVNINGKVTPVLLSTLNQ